MSIYPEVRTVTYDGKIFPFKDNEFDICWSNAVIEHVGNFDSQTLFLKELLRAGKSVYFTTPNRLFPIEIHNRLPLLHYLPKKIFDKILIMLNKTHWIGDNLNLLSYGKIKRMLELANVKNYRIERNKLFGFTMDFVVTIKEK